MVFPEAEAGAGGREGLEGCRQRFVEGVGRGGVYFVLHGDVGAETLPVLGREPLPPLPFEVSLQLGEGFTLHAEGNAPAEFHQARDFQRDGRLRPRHRPEQVRDCRQVGQVVKQRQVGIQVIEGRREMRLPQPVQVREGFRVEPEGQDERRRLSHWCAGVRELWSLGV